MSDCFLIGIPGDIPLHPTNRSKVTCSVQSVGFTPAVQCRGGKVFPPLLRIKPGSALLIIWVDHFLNFFHSVRGSTVLSHDWMSSWSEMFLWEKEVPFFHRNYKKNPHSGRLKWRTAKKRLFLKAGLQQFLFWNVMTTDSDASSAF